MPAVSVYKPIAHGGGPLVVLMSRDTPDYQSIALVDASGKVIDVGRYDGRTNGGRPTYRFSRRGHEYRQHGNVAIAAGGATYPIGNPGIRDTNVSAGRLPQQTTTRPTAQRTGTVAGQTQEDTSSGGNLLGTLATAASQLDKADMAKAGEFFKNLGTRFQGRFGAGASTFSTTGAQAAGNVGFKGPAAFAQGGSSGGAAGGASMGAIAAPIALIIAGLAKQSATRKERKARYTQWLTGTGGETNEFLSPGISYRGDAGGSSFLSGEHGRVVAALNLARENGAQVNAFRRAQPDESGQMIWELRGNGQSAVNALKGLDPNTFLVRENYQVADPKSGNMLTKSSYKPTKIPVGQKTAVGRVAGIQEWAASDPARKAAGDAGYQRYLGNMQALPGSNVMAPKPKKPTVNVTQGMQ